MASTPAPSAPAHVLDTHTDFEKHGFAKEAGMNVSPLDDDLANVQRPLSFQTNDVTPLNTPQLIEPPFFPTPAQSCRLSVSKRSVAEPLRGKGCWLSKGAHVALRLASMLLGTATAGLLVHSLFIYSSNNSVKLREGQLPMAWPAQTKLTATVVLLGAATLHHFVSILLLLLSFFSKSFRRRTHTRYCNRIGARTLAVALWVAALVFFRVLDASSKASLANYACANRTVLSNGQHRYLAVCTEQTAAFFLGVGAGVFESLALASLIVSAVRHRRDRDPGFPGRAKLRMGYAA